MRRRRSKRKTIDRLLWQCSKYEHEQECKIMYKDLEIYNTIFLINTVIIIKQKMLNLFMLWRLEIKSLKSAHSTFIEENMSPLKQMYWLRDSVEANLDLWYELDMQNHYKHYTKFSK